MVSEWKSVLESAVQSWVKNLEAETLQRHKVMRALLGKTVKPPKPPTQIELDRRAELDRIKQAAYKRIRETDLEHVVRTIAMDGEFIIHDAINHWDGKTWEYGSDQYESDCTVTADDGTVLFNSCCINSIFRDGPWVERAIAYAAEIEKRPKPEEPPAPKLSAEERHEHELQRYARWED